MRFIALGIVVACFAMAIAADSKVALWTTAALSVIAVIVLLAKRATRCEEQTMCWAHTSRCDLAELH